MRGSRAINTHTPLEALDPEPVTDTLVHRDDREAFSDGVSGAEARLCALAGVDSMARWSGEGRSSRSAHHPRSPPHEQRVADRAARRTELPDAPGPRCARLGAPDEFAGEEFS